MNPLTLGGGEEEFNDSISLPQSPGYTDGSLNEESGLEEMSQSSLDLIEHYQGVQVGSLLSAKQGREIGISH